MASTSLRRRRPLLYLLIAGFVVGVVWLTRAVWRPLRGRGAVTPLRDVSATPPGPPPAPAAGNRPDARSAPGPGPVAGSRPHIALVPEPDPQPADATAADPVPDATPPEPLQPVATDTSLDDLTRIEGIGRRMAAALVSEGFSTFEALGLASPAQLRAALANQGLRFAPSLSTWPEQARLLADGDEAGFAELSARLRRGGASA